MPIEASSIKISQVLTDFTSSTWHEISYFANTQMHPGNKGHTSDSTQHVFFMGFGFFFALNATFSLSNKWKNMDTQTNKK